MYTPRAPLARTTSRTVPRRACMRAPPRLWPHTSHLDRRRARSPLRPRHSATPRSRPQAFHRREQSVAAWLPRATRAASPQPALRTGLGSAAAAVASALAPKPRACRSTRRKASSRHRRSSGRTSSGARMRSNGVGQQHKCCGPDREARRRLQPEVMPTGRGRKRRRCRRWTRSRSPSCSHRARKRRKRRGRRHALQTSVPSPKYPVQLQRCWRRRRAPFARPQELVSPSKTPLGQRQCRPSWGLHTRRKRKAVASCHHQRRRGRNSTRWTGDGARKQSCARIASMTTDMRPGLCPRLTASVRTVASTATRTRAVLRTVSAMTRGPEAEAVKTLVDWT
mmetsp:Transcript_2556/g.10205  ORF Transcript_2556/g.10205 Transcript_2556/m.10205 type:complete len:338 (-) Transcript_2556:267-1280(-)